MKKLSIIFMALGMVAIAACGANTTKTISYNVATGDEISVKLVTTDGYDISEDVPFVLTCEEEELSHGTFLQGDYYDDYANVAETDENAEVLDSGEKDDNKYVFWRYEGEGHTEYNYVIQIGESDTALILANDVSEESAKECFERLTIEEK